MNKMTVRDINVTGKRVLVRVDFNVPLDVKTGAITDDSRIRAVLPTIKYLIEHKAKIIMLSHFGRPKGKVVDEMRLAPAAKRLAEILHDDLQQTLAAARLQLSVLEGRLPGGRGPEGDRGAGQADAQGRH